MAAKDFEVSLLKYQNTPSLYPLKAPSSLFRFTTNNSVAVNFDDVSPQLLLELTHSLLSRYVQLNYTGPPTAEDSNSKLPFFEGGLDWTAANEQALSELSRLGEPAYYLVKQPLLLVLTLKLLGILHPGLPEDKKDTNLDESKAYPTPLSENYPLAHTILCHRATLLHLRLLDSPVPPQQWILSLPEPVDLASHPDLRATYLLTLSSLHLSITSPPISSEISKSREYLLKAIELEGLEYELTGIVGKRTKFQVEDKAQLVLLVKENGKEAIDYSIDGAKLPNLLQLNDDTLLEAPTYSLTSPLPVPKPAAPSLSSHILPNTMAALPFPPPPLHPRSQALLLHLLEHQRLGFSGKEQLSSYLAPILSAPSNWSVTTLALLERSRLEFGRSRTVERGVWQMRELREEVLNLEVATLNREQAMEEAKDRLRFFFDLPEFPSSWSLSKELGKAYYSLGVIKSALEVFASLHLWEDVIYCYLNLSSLDLGGQRGVDKGLEVVQQLIKGEKVESDEVMRMATTTTMDKNRLGKLYCLLGDLMGQDVASYEKAYEISKTPRAARSLGYAYYSRSDFRSSQEWFKRALAVHPLFTKAWFTLGCANMRLEDWKEGVHAFSRCVSLEEEEGESWSNLGSCHLRLKPDPYFYFLQDGKMLDVEPADWDRWCEYIFFRGLHRIGYARVTRGSNPSITDTELQVIKLLVPDKPLPPGHISYHKVDEAEIPLPYRFPRTFKGFGHEYHVLGAPNPKPYYYAIQEVPEDSQAGEKKVTEGS
ncbi:TPR-like protein [Atractiella rhizophila]|nr:TPR-like protein [Atractiella rhizophila]